MAVYEFRCLECEALFEVRRPMAEASAPAPCPAGHVDTRRLLSVFATATAAGPGDAPSPAGDLPAGGCCGGACGCA